MSLSAQRELLPLGSKEETRPLVGAPAERPPRRSCSGRCAAIAGASVLAALLMMSELSRGVTMQPRPKFSLEDRYSMWKIKSENEQLKEQLEKMERRLREQQEKEMRSAADKAAKPLSEPAKLDAEARPTSATAERLAIAKRSVAAKPPDYKLTPERIRAHCDEHNIILITFVNSKRANYAYTWAAHIIRLKLTNYMVGAMDGEALVKLTARNISAFDMASGLTTADYGWGTKNFRQLGLRKTELILSLLRAGADPIVTDADALITKDPTPYVLRYAREADILVTSDMLASTASDDGLEKPERSVHAAWNIGYFYLKHTTLAAMQHWGQKCADNPTLWDQNLFKDVLKIGGLDLPPRGSDLERKRLFRGYNRTLTIGILPVRTFCSGHTYFVQRMPQRARVEPYSVHTTFQYSGAVGKIHRLRESHLWEDEPSYFAPTKGLLVYTPRVRRELIRRSGVMDVASHFELVHHQLVQIRAAFLLAEALGRLLVLPRIVCGLDRFWAPHNGTIPGSDTTLPIEPCPADHVLDLEKMDGQLAGKLDGLLREYSFLDNPRLPPGVRESTKVLAPPATLGDADLAPLRALSGTRVLNLTSMPDLFATLPGKASGEAFVVQRRMREWTSIWCCSPPLAPRAPGHVWYDMFFDVVPHTDRHRKEWRQPWNVTFGP